MRRLSGVDTLMLYTDSSAAQNTIAPIILCDPSTRPDGKLTRGDVLKHVESRLDVSSTFRERLIRIPLGLDRPLWVRDSRFDLDYHVREIALPSPGTWEQLCVQVARLGANRLDLSRPPWELYLIQGLDSIDWLPAGSVAIMLRLHHAAVDGVAGVELVNALLSHAPDVSGADADGTSWQGESPPSTVRTVAEAAARTAVRPLQYYRELAELVTHVPRSVRHLVRPRPGTGSLMPVAATRFNAPVSPHRVWGAVTAPLAEIKRIKKAVDGATVNDVAMSVVGGAVRRYLDAKGELPDSSLTTIMPISVRPTMAQKDDPTQVSAGDGGNRFAMTIIQLATDVSDPLERLHVLRRNTAGSRELGESALALVDASEALPGALIGTAQRAVLRMLNATGRTVGAHLITTNVPGPRTHLYFAGARAELMTGMAPVVSGVGLINAIGSYADTFFICWTACRDMLSDSDVYERCVREELNALSLATGGSGL